MSRLETGIPRLRRGTGVWVCSAQWQEVCGVTLRLGLQLISCVLLSRVDLYSDSTVYPYNRDIGFHTPSIPRPYREEEIMRLARGFVIISVGQSGSICVVSVSWTRQTHTCLL